MNRMWRARGFSLIELLVAVAVFALAAALAWGGLAAVAHTRERLGAEQQAFAAVTRSVDLLSRDLAQAVWRPIRDVSGVRRPAFVGEAARVEFTRAGFAGAPGTVRSDLERVLWQLDGTRLIRARWLALDRAPSSQPVPRTLHDDVRALKLRYLDADGRWQTRWPASDRAPPLPRAVELRVEFEGLGDIRRVVELVEGVAVTPPERPAP